MNTQTFTPGPWIADDRHPEDIARYVMAGISPICRISLQGPCVVREEAEANARLIAAAPDLLDALRDVIGWVPSASCFATLEPMRAVERARAAIAKATGATDES